MLLSRGAPASHKNVVKAFQCRNRCVTALPKPELASLKPVSLSANSCSLCIPQRGLNPCDRTQSNLISSETSASATHLDTRFHNPRTAAYGLSNGRFEKQRHIPSPVPARAQAERVATCPRNPEA